uniref:Uncharacterized protein n=1 Tax=Knipowitschia caucasica TaxID=637954 RepID=A0AAV2LEH2_KNICA
MRLFVGNLQSDKVDWMARPLGRGAESPSAPTAASVSSGYRTSDPGSVTELMGPQPRGPETSDSPPTSDTGAVVHREEQGERRIAAFRYTGIGKQLGSRYQQEGYGSPGHKQPHTERCLQED